MKSFAFIICMAVPLMLVLSGCSGVKELHSAMNDAAAVGELSLIHISEPTRPY